MRAVFADISFFLVLFTPNDQHHRIAVQANAALTAPIITTAWVLVEFANAISASQVRKNFRNILADLRAAPDVEIVAPPSGVFDRGCELYVARQDK